MNDFENKVVFISGAASGIGWQTAQAFASEGARLILSDLNGELMKHKVSSLAGNHLALACDVSNSDDVENVISMAIRKWGQLDIAVNNAGYGVMKSITSCSKEEWQKVIDVNLTGAWLCMKYQLKQMEKQRAGVIVNIASVLGLTAAQGGDSAYTAAKHGVVGLTKSAALDYAKYGIRVNAVCPASIHTPMLESMMTDPKTKAQIENIQPLGRVGEVQEVSQSVLWLASEQASFITGIALPLDGGVMAGIKRM